MKIQHCFVEKIKTILLIPLSIILLQNCIAQSCTDTAKKIDYSAPGAGFESLLNDYFRSDKPQTLGLPSVTYCAEQLHLSPKYFGDLVKKETGKTAQEYIQLKLIDMAKEKIFDTSKSISEVAYELGFKYPSHFTRLFKQQVGQSPNKYRSLLN